MLSFHIEMFLGVIACKDNYIFWIEENIGTLNIIKKNGKLRRILGYLKGNVYLCAEKI